MKRQNGKIVELTSWRRYQNWKDRKHPAARFFLPFGVQPVRGLAEAPLEGWRQIRALWRQANRRPRNANVPDIETFSEARERLGIDDAALEREIRMTRLGYAVAYIFFAVGVLLFCSTLIDIFSGAAQSRQAVLVISDLFWRTIWIFLASGQLFYLAYFRWQMEEQVISLRGFLRQKNLFSRIWFGF